MRKKELIRRLFALGLVSCMCLSMIGCGGNETASEAPVSEVQASEVPAPETQVSEGVQESDAVTEAQDKPEASAEDKTSEAVGEKEPDAVVEDIQPNEEGTPILRDSVMKTIGTRVGCAVTQSEIQDPKVWEIVTTHFSAVSIGNELKPDALFGYSIGHCPGTKTVEFNGEQLVVPYMDYSRAESILDKFVEWNAQNPDRIIQIRGHVLVWHAQTPEWFFHVDYDKNKEYADIDTMNKRLEWYIATVLDHFTGDDSKYKGLFYGWDVVNEAVGDGTGTYRTDAMNPNESLSEDRHSSNSSWWHVYQSNEYIINAFKYANKYAPADLELYYNDYNETDIVKMKGIKALLEAVKEQEGEPGVGTRITAMGMQGHYGMDTPSFTAIQSAIEEYGKIVGKVQITEMDISASSDYDGSEEKKADENEKLRKRYNMIYFAIKSTINSGEVEFDGLTFWGTVDHYSWLQSRSNIGGGNTTGLPQCPLLFDENYEPKPAFYVFADVQE